MQMHHAEKLLELNHFCLEQGIFWLQGPGGNTSIKNPTDGTLLIKPSGYRIENVKSTKDLAVVNLKKFLNDFPQITDPDNKDSKEQLYKDLITSCNLNAQLRPSMETGFHAVLESRYVFHIHSLIAMLICDLKDKSKFNTWYKSHWQKTLGQFCEVPALMPGADLAINLQKHKNIPIIFLKNHGTILQFEDSDFIKKYQQFELAVLKEFFPKAIMLRVLKTFPKDLLTGPIKFYFPDFVILYPRISTFLKKRDEDNYSLDESCQKKDVDVYENWIASQILFHINSSLGQLPQEIIENVPYLPTELVRKNIMERS